MKFPLALASIALTALCWGIYGPVLHEGQQGLGIPLQPSSLRPFICVGLAYFAIAVVVPLILLKIKGENGKWTSSGTIWSLGAGVAGALGALGIVLAFKFRGNPVYVMPLVFGCAPVVNTFCTMAMSKSYNEAGRMFFLGVAVVALGAAGVMFFKPEAKNISVNELQDGKIEVKFTQIVHGVPEAKSWTAPSLELLKTDPGYEKAYRLYLKTRPLQSHQRLMIPLSIALTAVCWGCYGPVLHKGQMKMAGSRLRPFLCVGLAYFAIAVVVPFILVPVFPEPGAWAVSGTVWSLLGGAAGAFGALGIIMAFTFGGKPIFVMPLVFGCAPVVNTFVTIWHEGTVGFVTIYFYASLLLVVIGAVTVLVFAPKGGHKPPGESKPSGSAKVPDDKVAVKGL